MFLIATAPLPSLAATGSLDGEIESSWPRVPARELVQMITDRLPITLREVHVIGDIDLRPLRTITSLFRCQNCRFSGSITSPDVEFAGPVDLAKSHINGNADFRSALFSQRFRADGAHFGGEADFEWSRFAGDASFRHSRFLKEADFRSAQFTARADFTAAKFKQRSYFSRAQLERGGDFRFSSWSDEADLAELSSGGLLTIAKATFSSHLILKHSRISSGLDLRGAQFRRNAKLFVDDTLSVGDLYMNVATAAHVKGRREAPADLLSQLESDAKQRDDIKVANEARYALLSYMAEDKTGIAWFWDRFFYRGIGGYLVRPSHSLWTLFVLVGVASVLRAIVNYRKDVRGKPLPAEIGLPQGGDSQRGTPGKGWGPVSAFVVYSVIALAEVVQGIGETLSVALRLKVPRDTSPQASTEEASKQAEQGARGQAQEAGNRTEVVLERTEEMRKVHQVMEARTDELQQAATQQGPGAAASLAASSKRWKLAAGVWRSTTAIWTRALHNWRTNVVGALSHHEQQLLNEQAQDLGGRLKLAGRWAEFLLYKSLLAVFFLSLGNANPTVRQLIDAIRV